MCPPPSKQQQQLNFSLPTPMRTSKSVGLGIVNCLKSLFSQFKMLGLKMGSQLRSIIQVLFKVPPSYV